MSVWRVMPRCELIVEMTRTATASVIGIQGYIHSIWACVGRPSPGGTRLDHCRSLLLSIIGLEPRLRGKSDQGSFKKFAMSTFASFT